MAHTEQQNFCYKIWRKFPERFMRSSTRVLDIGSQDVNGNNKWMFMQGSPWACEYIGIDVGPGKNVDVVASGHEYKSAQPFDIVLSTECLEHDSHWEDTLVNMWKLAKPGGLILFTCASFGRPEHGTTRTMPEASPYTTDYYLNLDENDVRRVWDCVTLFSEYNFEYNPISKDLYFYGIKK